MTTPVRAILNAASSLRVSVKDGLGALEGSHMAYLEESVRPMFADSLDIDDGLRNGNEQEHRWDYLLGLSSASKVVGLEPHSAHTSEVGTVIAKKRAARHQLRTHIKPSAKIAAWFWVASGKVDFAPHEKAITRLDQEGITFVGRRLLPKHLSSL